MATSSARRAGAALRRTRFELLEPEGRGWSLLCPVCDESTETGAGGTCPRCATELLHELPGTSLPTVRAPLPPPPALLESRRACANAARILAAATAAVGFTVGSNLMLLLLPPGFLVGLFGGVVGVMASTPFGAILLEVARQLEELRYWGPSRPLDDRIALGVARQELVMAHGRRGLLLELGAALRDPGAEHLELVLRVRGPDGHYLRAADAIFRGEHGEFLLRRRLRVETRCCHGAAHGRVLLPLRALVVPPAAERLELTAEVLFVLRGEVLAERDVEVSVTPLPEEFPVMLPGEVEELPADEIPTCAVCAGPLVDGARGCTRCGVPSHADCRGLVGGCPGAACA